LISQGTTGGQGFYVGNISGNIRLTDQYPGGIPVSFLAGAHDILLTSGGGNGAKLFLDGTQVFSAAADLVLNNQGSNTRFGSQFSPYGESYTGTLDNIRVFSGIASYAQASTAGGPAVPEPSAWLLMLGGFGLMGAALRRRPRMLATA
jgi:hypothetical protein